MGIMTFYNIFTESLHYKASQVLDLNFNTTDSWQYDQ